MRGSMPTKFLRSPWYGYGETLAQSLRNQSLQVNGKKWREEKRRDSVLEWSALSLGKDP